MIVEDQLATRWRTARPDVAGIHLDSAACSRQSNAVLEATTAHAHHEAEVGGYVAAAAAEPTLAAGKAALASLAAMTAADIAFTTGSGHALDLFLGAWPGPRTIACAPGEYGPNLAIMAANGFEVMPLPVDDLGRVVIAEAATTLETKKPGLVHLTAVASHRGVAQPMQQFSEVCRSLGIPLVLDAAQALGQLDCAVGADVVYSSSRKWLAGPRGVGFLAVAPQLAVRLVRRLPPAQWDVLPGGPALGALASFDHHEANVAARVGYSVAVGELLAAGAETVRTRLAQVAAAARRTLDGTAGWQVVEPTDEPTAITTFVPPTGVNPAQIRRWLIEQRGIVTTVAETARAPFELTGPVLRISPHVDATAADLEVFGAALEEATGVSLPK